MVYANDDPNGIAAAAETIVAGAAVAIHTDGLVYNANATVGGTLQVPCAGFIGAAAVITDDVSIIREGIMDGASGLTIGAPVYLAEGSDGAVTSTAPTTTGDAVQVVGHAISATKFFIAINPLHTIV